MRKKKKASDIKVGVIGYGGAFGMGRHHVLGAKKAGMTPVAVCDIDEKQLAAAKEAHPGIETYKSVSGMLKNSDIDLAVVITPHNTHATIVVQCLNSGKHVICEKPMAVTTAECDRMIAAAKRKRLMLSVYQSRHWDGCIIRAVKALKSKPIGDVVRVQARIGRWGHPGNTWRSSKSMAGSVLHDWGAHMLEYTLQIIDAEIVEVTGFTTRGFWAKKTVWKEDTIEDEAFLVVRYSNGVWSAFMMSYLESVPREGCIEITGTEGTYLFDHETWTMVTHKGGNVVTTKGRNPEAEWWGYYKNIVNHLIRGEKLTITAEWARRTIHIMDLGLQSAKRGRSMRAKYK